MLMHLFWTFFLSTSQADLYFNLALGTTLVWIPLTLAAVGRALYVK